MVDIIAVVFMGWMAALGVVFIVIEILWWRERSRFYMWCRALRECRIEEHLK